jgi:hypothetical protein
MSKPITVKCPTCSYSWEVDLDNHQAERTVFRGPQKVKVEEYRFKCPQDGTYFIVPVTVKE